MLTAPVTRGVMVRLEEKCLQLAGVTRNIASTSRAMSARMSAHVAHPSVCRRVAMTTLLTLPDIAVGATLNGSVTDALTGSEPLSTDISHPIVLLQGILVVLFLAIASAGIVVGDRAMFGGGVWTTAQ
jgi:hypothetical protein